MAARRTEAGVAVTAGGPQDPVEPAPGSQGAGEPTAAAAEESADEVLPAPAGEHPPTHDQAGPAGEVTPGWWDDDEA